MVSQLCLSLSVDQDPLHKCSSRTPGLCVSLEAISSRWKTKQSCIHSKMHFSSRTCQKPPLLCCKSAPKQVSLTTQREAACAQRPRWRTPRFRTCSRADSARAPNPLEPYPTRAGQLHVTHSKPSQSRPELCLHVTANPTYSRAGEDGDWLMRIPWANDAPYALSVHQWSVSVRRRRRARGVDDHMFNFN